MSNFAIVFLTGPDYLLMLQEFFRPQMEEQDDMDNFMFMQDGAPPHWSRAVRDFLDEWLPNRWVGRGGPIAWPARSPDLTPCDFFLWSFVRQHVYRDPVANIQELKERISTAIALVTDEMLRKTWEEIDLRLNQVVAARGGHIEA